MPNPTQACPASAPPRAKIRRSETTNISAPSPVMALGNRLIQALAAISASPVE